MSWRKRKPAPATLADLRKSEEWLRLLERRVDMLEGPKFTGATDGPIIDRLEEAVRSPVQSPLNGWLAAEKDRIRRDSQRIHERDLVIAFLLRELECEDAILFPSDLKKAEKMLRGGKLRIVQDHAGEVSVRIRPNDEVTL